MLAHLILSIGTSIIGKYNNSVPKDQKLRWIIRRDGRISRSIAMRPFLFRSLSALII